MIASLVPILLIGRSGKPGSSYIPDSSRQACSYCIRGTLIRYGGRHLLVWRSPLFLWVKTMGNVMDSNLMHINDLPQPYSTLTRPQRGLISSLYHYSVHTTLFQYKFHSSVLTKQLYSLHQRINLVLTFPKQF